MKHMVMGAFAGMMSVVIGAATISLIAGNLNTTGDVPVGFSDIGDNNNKQRKNKPQRIGDGKAQEGACWCWAASIQTLFKSKNIQLSQTEICKAALGGRIDRNKEMGWGAMQDTVRNLNKGLHLGFKNCYLPPDVPYNVTDEEMSGKLKSFFEKYGALSYYVGHHWVTITGYDKSNNKFQYHDSLGQGGIFEADCTCFCTWARERILNSSENVNEHQVSIGYLFNLINTV